MWLSCFFVFLQNLSKYRIVGYSFEGLSPNLLWSVNAKLASRKDKSQGSVDALWGNRNLWVKLLTTSNVCWLFYPAPFQSVTQLFVDLPGRNEKHSAMATPWVQLAFWFIEIHCWPLLSHQLCGESQTDTSQFLSLLSLYLVSSRCQTFFFASSVAKREVIYPAKPQLTADTRVGAADAWSSDAIMPIDPQIFLALDLMHRSNIS